MKCTLDEKAFATLCYKGFRLSEAVVQAERALGSIIVLEIGTCLLSLILGIFFGVGLIDAILNQNIPSVLFFYGLYQSTVSILALIRLFVVFSCGQKLTQEIQKSVQTIEDLILDFELSENLKNKLTILINRLHRKAGIRPLNCFDLSWSTALSCFGFLITCTVILLQFKFTELHMPINASNFSA